MLPGADAEGGADCAGVDPKLKLWGAEEAAVVESRGSAAAAEEAPEAAAEAMLNDRGADAGAAAGVLPGSGVLTAREKAGVLLAAAAADVLAGAAGK